MANLQDDLLMSRVNELATEYLGENARIFMDQSIYKGWTVYPPAIGLDGSDPEFLKSPLEYVNLALTSYVNTLPYVVRTRKLQDDKFKELLDKKKEEIEALKLEVEKLKPFKTYYDLAFKMAHGNPKPLTPSEVKELASSGF